MNVTETVRFPISHESLTVCRPVSLINSHQLRVNVKKLGTNETSMSKSDVHELDLEVDAFPRNGELG
jgi:hypothetical protein